MNLKNITLSVLSVIAFMAFSFTQPSGLAPEKAVYEVDTEKSNLEWVGKKVTGEHNGTIKISDGSLVLVGEKLKGGTFSIDMSSISNTDIEDEENNQKLVGHLKSKDFFHTQKYPEATFEITSLKSKGNGKYDVTGNLTIKGITNEISFPAKINVGKEEVTAKAKITIDRTKFDVRYGSGSFFDNLGDKTIYDDFELDLDLVAKK